MFALPSLPSAAEDIAFRKEPYVSPEKYLTVTCPQCGNIEDAKERRFFGVLGPRGLRVVLTIFVAALIATVGYVIWTDFH